MNNIVIITPSIREESLAILSESLGKQTVQNFHWIVCSPFLTKEIELIGLTHDKKYDPDNKWQEKFLEGEKVFNARNGV